MYILSNIAYIIHGTRHTKSINAYKRTHKRLRKPSPRLPYNHYHSHFFLFSTLLSSRDVIFIVITIKNASEGLWWRQDGRQAGRKSDSDCIF